MISLAAGKRKTFLVASLLLEKKKETATNRVI
jgi:hypothetical protein